MSTMDFKNYYLAGMILVLLFGVGVGYQISQWVNDKDAVIVTNTNQVTDPNAYPSESSPQAQPEVYVRTGRVENVNPTSLSFTTYVQNSNGTYSKVVLTAQITQETSFSKINLADTAATPVDITVDDIAVGSEVAVSSAENMYGKTAVTADTIQLHVF